MKKTLTILATLALVAAISIGGTLAYLTAKTDAVTNTFTVGNVAITLDESKLENDGTLDTATRVQTNSYKMIPGNTVAKDPAVAVTAGSEACWLFVKVEETTGLTNYLSYTVDTNWTALTGTPGVYYRSVNATDANNGVKYFVLKDNEVSILNTVTQEMMNAITNKTTAQPELTFTAYAVQSANVATVAAAWDAVKTL